jgi:hypothetical protein
VTEDKGFELLVHGLQRAGKDEIMKTNKNNETTMKSEYDFSKGVIGKYAKANAKGTNTVILDPEVAHVFPDSRSVNEALRSLLPIIKCCGYRFPCAAADLFACPLFILSAYPSSCRKSGLRISLCQQELAACSISE